VSAAVGGVVAVLGASARADGTDGFSSLVEDYSYPNAAQILDQQHIKLLSGDGHIILADCSTTPVNNIGVLKVHSADDAGVSTAFCFRILANTGVLFLDVPGVFDLHGDGVTNSGAGHQVTADVQPKGGDTVHVPVDPDGTTQVGIGADPGSPPTTLLKLTVTG
jgi:hypothetical protein